MKVYSDYGVTALHPATHGPNGLLKLEGTIDAGAAATIYVQIHDARVTPANGVEPIKSWAVAAGQSFYKEFKDGELTFNDGLYICVSTTEATKTLGTGSNQFTYVSAELVNAEESVTVVGDTTTAVNTLAVWAESAGPKRLRKINAVISMAGPRYLKLFAKDTPVVGDKPLLEWTVTASGPVNADFGKAGYPVFAKEADGTERVGCSLFKESTSGAYTGVTGTLTFTIRAEYV